MINPESMLPHDQDPYRLEISELTDVSPNELDQNCASLAQLPNTPGSTTVYLDTALLGVLRGPEIRSTLTISLDRLISRQQIPDEYRVLDIELEPAVSGALGVTLFCPRYPNEEGWYPQVIVRYAPPIVEALPKFHHLIKLGDQWGMIGPDTPSDGSVDEPHNFGPFPLGDRKALMDHLLDKQTNDVERLACQTLLSLGTFINLRFSNA